MRFTNVISACVMMVGAALSAERPAAAQVNLNEGDIAIIGWMDNPTDAFTIVALADLPGGTVFYVTDNGWTGTQYRGASAHRR